MYDLAIPEFDAKCDFDRTIIILRYFNFSFCIPKAMHADKGYQSFLACIITPAKCLSIKLAVT